MRKGIIAIGIVLLAVFFSGCEDSDPTATLTIINNSSYTIDEVYASPSSSDSWGSNRLSSNISAGSFGAVTIPADDYIDVWADDVTDTVYWEAYGQYTSEGEEYFWTLADPSVSSISPSSPNTTAGTIPHNFSIEKRK